MSRTRPSLRNPVSKFIEFKNKDKQFFYYDRSSKEEISLDLPLRFIVLDKDRVTITGFSKKYNSGIYSNEVGRLSDPLNVKVFGTGTVASGTWSEIKDKVDSVGGHFCRVVYSIMKFNDKFEYVALKFDRAALGVWFNFEKSLNIKTQGVCIQNKFTQKTNEAITYNLPVFETLALNEEQMKIADEMDAKLQEYFDAYKSNQGEEEVSEDKEDAFQDKKGEYEQASRGGDEGFVPVEKSDPADKVKETDEGFRQEGQELPF